VANTNDKTQKILELLKYHNSADLRNVQTKFTKTANSIKRDAVQSRLSALYTGQELEILTQAASILINTKNKIEHAKEVKAREEKRLEQLEKEYKRKEEEIIEKYINFEGMTHMETFLMYCCLNHFIGSYKFRADEIENLFKYPDRFPGQVNDWRREIRSELMRKFPWRVEPDEKIITDFLRSYKLKYRKEVSDRFKASLDLLNTFIAVQNGENVEILKK